MDATNQPDEMLTTSGVARLLGLSRATVWRHVQSGRLPQATFGSGRGSRWSAAGLSGWLRGRDESSERIASERRRRTTMNQSAHGAGRAGPG